MDGYSHKVLVLHGAINPFIPAKQLQDFQTEMEAAKVDWQLISYGGVVHSFTNPSSSKSSLPGVAYNESADKRSWQAMKQFFAEIFQNK